MRGCETRKNLTRHDFVIQQFEVPGLSAFSYYIQSLDQAVVIDPIRDSDIYSYYLDDTGVTLNAVIMTHIHSDYISGHLELSNTFNCPILFGPGAEIAYNREEMKDGQTFPLGSIFLQFFHTPGHTKESVSVLLLDHQKMPSALFTGDCLLIGGVGQPDKNISSDISQEDLIYESVQKIKKIVSDATVLFPAHGPGPHCGNHISSATCDTVANQKKTNNFLIWSKEKFLASAQFDLSPLDYYPLASKINKQGPRNLSSILENSFKSIPSEQFFHFLNKDVIILDTRDFNGSYKSFIKGSYLITLKMPFEFWVARIIPPDVKISLITEIGEEKESIIRLARIGYENVIGFLQGGYEAIKNYCIQGGYTDYLAGALQIEEKDLKQIVDSQSLSLLDVREDKEWRSTGVIPNSNLMSAMDLEKNISTLSSLKKRIGIYCKSGARSALGASILAKYGIEDVAFLRGVDLLFKNGVQAVPYGKSIKFDNK